MKKRKIQRLGIRGLRDEGEQTTPKKVKQKAPAKERPAAAPTAEGEIRDLLSKSQIVLKKREQRKKLMQRGGIGAGIAALGGVVYLFFLPSYGGMQYGMCKTFLELQVRYPQYLTYSTTEWFEDSIRIWFTQLDGFGQFRMEPVQCYYKEDPQMGYVLSRVTISRRPVDQAVVDKFNKSAYVLLSHRPDLRLPPELPDSLEGLQFNTDKYRKPLL